MMNYGRKRSAIGSGYDAEMKRQRQAYGYEPGKMGYGFGSGMSSMNGQKSSAYGNALYGTSLDYGQKSVMETGGGYGGGMSSSTGLYGNKTGNYNSLTKKTNAFGSAGGYNGSTAYGTKPGGMGYSSGYGMGGSASSNYTGSAFGTATSFQEEEDFTQDVDYTEVDPTSEVVSFGTGKPKANMNTGITSRLYNMTQMVSDVDDEPFDESYEYGYFQQSWGAPNMGTQGRGRGFGGRGAQAANYPQFREGRGRSRGRGAQQMQGFQGAVRGRGGPQQMQRGFQSGAGGRGGGSQQMQWGFQAGPNRLAPQQQFGRFGAQQQQQQQQQQNRRFGAAGNKMDKMGDPNKMSMSNKISQLSQVLRNTHRMNSIQAIRDGINSSRLNLTCDFAVEELDVRFNGRSIFTGCLKINDVFIYRSVALSKKELKHDVYSASYDLLTTKSAADVLARKDVTIEAIQVEVLSCIQQEKSLEETIQRVKDLREVANFANPSKGFDMLKKYLLKECGGSTLPSNQIACLEQAISASKCKLMRRYDPELIKVGDASNTGLSFRGTFFINNIPIAVGRALSKKEAKRECYSIAITNICTKSLVEVMKGVSVENKREESSLSEGAATGSSKTVEQKFNELIRLVKNTQHKEQYIVNMDKILVHIGMIAKCIYRLSSEKLSITCNLCIEDIVIASGESSKKKESQMEAYKNAWAFLQTSDTASILKQNEKLESKSQNSSSNTKGWIKTSESNLAMLQKKNLDHTESWRTPEVMVVLEHTDSPDRINNAFHILNYSAVQNGMLLEWKWENVSDKFKCTVTLQKQDVGEALGPSKKISRNLASAKAIFKYYATGDVLRMHSHKDQDPSRWVRYEEIKKRAEVIKTTVKTDTSQTSEANSGDASEQGADPFLVDIYKSLINKFAARETLDTLVLDPATPRQVTKELQSYTQKIEELRSERRFYEGFPYMIIVRQYTPQKMVQIIQKGTCTDTYPRASLVPKSDLPDDSELEELVKKNEEIEASEIPAEKEKPESQPRGGGRGRFRGKGRGRGKGAGADTLWKAREVFEQMF